MRRNNRKISLYDTWLSNFGYLIDAGVSEGDHLPQSIPWPQTA